MPFSLSFSSFSRVRSLQLIFFAEAFRLSLSFIYFLSIFLLNALIITHEKCTTTTNESLHLIYINVLKVHATKYIGWKLAVLFCTTYCSYYQLMATLRWMDLESKELMKGGSSPGSTRVIALLNSIHSSLINYLHYLGHSTSKKF